MEKKSEELTLKGYFAVFKCELNLWGLVRTFDTLDEVRDDIFTWFDMCDSYPMCGSVTVFDSRTMRNVFEVNY
jgi:hypothetical protein